MKLLIVEDEKALSDSISSYLEQESFICDQAGSYAGALAKIEQYDYDCILLDINLQDGNGLELLKELKSNHKGDGVLIISARNSLEDKVSGLKLGADDYLVKPSEWKDLVQVVQDLHDKWITKAARSRSLRAKLHSLKPAVHSKQSGVERPRPRV